MLPFFAGGSQRVRGGKRSDERFWRGGGFKGMEMEMVESDCLANRVVIQGTMCSNTVSCWLEGEGVRIVPV